MILLDSDVLLIDLRYKNDPRYSLNRQFLDHLQNLAMAKGVTLQVLLEVAGVMSFNLSPADIPVFPGLLCAQYGLSVWPNYQKDPSYAGCTVPDLIAQISLQMSLGDAVQAVQIARSAGHADCLVTWNANHFQNKLVIPALTPEEWLLQKASGTP